MSVISNGIHYSSYE